MATISSQLNIICLETEAFYQLVEEVISRMSKEDSKEDKWIDDEEAMRLLKVKSKTTLQKFRNEGKIRFSQVAKKLILYDRDSIIEFIESKAKDTF